MTNSRKTWTAWKADEAATKADKISEKAYGLASMLKLCAFACEARRTLTGIEDALTWRDAEREDLRDHVHQMTAWQEMHDASGDALQYIVREMEQATEESANLVYRLAKHLRELGEGTGTADRGEAES